MGSRSPRPNGLRRSVRWEKGSLDLFLFPPHPIFRWNILMEMIELSRLKGFFFVKIDDLQV